MTAQDRNPGNADKSGWRGKKSAAGKSTSAWRKPGVNKAVGSRTHGESGNWWQRKKDRSYEQALRRHRLKTAFWLLLSLVLVVCFLVWILWRPVRTPLLAVAVTDYKAPLPPNAWAAEDIDRLHELSGEDIVSPFAMDRWTQGDSIKHWLATLRAELDRRKPSGPDADGAVIVYLSMHGVVDGRGEPCLLPPAAGLASGDDESASWLSVRRLLEYLFVEERPARPPRESKKLLILDCNRIDADWGFGVLHNTFAQRLREVVEEVRQKAPNLAVINSVAPNQVAWAAPELRGSVFGYYVASGLRGAADLDEDRRVTLDELVRYLQAEVNLWTTVNRSAAQTPMLLPAGADFALVHVAERRPFALPAYEPDPRWEKVARMWHRHVELQKVSPWRLHPLNWQSYQRGLLRLEQLAEAGGEYAGAFEAEIARLERLADELALDPLTEGLIAHSLPLAVVLRQTDRRTCEKLEKRIEEQIAEMGQSPPSGSISSQARPAASKNAAETNAANVADDKKQRKSSDASGDTSDSKKQIIDGNQQNVNPIDSCIAKGRKATDGSLVPRPKMAGTASISCAGINKSQNPEEPATEEQPSKIPSGEMVEQHLLSLMQNYLDEKVWRDVGNPPCRALQVRMAAEAAAAPMDVRTQYWARPGVSEGDRLRRRGEDSMFIGSVGELLAAERCWKEALDDGYVPAQRLTAKAEKALQARDDSWSKTVYLAAWLFSRLNNSDADDIKQQLDVLRRLIDDTNRLASELDVAVADGRWNGDLADRVSDELALLEKSYFDQCYKLRAAGREEQTLCGIAAVLRVPLVSGSQRNRLRQKYLDIAARRAADWRQLADSPAGSRRTAGMAVQESNSANYLQRLSYWDTQHPHNRQHPVLSILSLPALDSEDDSLGNVAGRRRNETANDSHDSALDASDEGTKTRQIERFYERQGALLRRRLADIGPDSPLCKKWMAESRRLIRQHDAAATAVRAPCAKAVRLVRAAAPLLGKQPWEQINDNPVQLLRRIDLRCLMLWHAKRSIDDFLGPVRGQTASFFQTAADGYLHSAKLLCRDAGSSQFDKTDLESLLAARVEAAARGIRVRPEGDLSIVDDKDTAAIAHETTVELSGALPPGEAAFLIRPSDGENATAAATNGSRPDRLVCHRSVPLIAADGSAGGGSQVSRMVLKVEPGESGKTHERLWYLIPDSRRLIAERCLNAVVLYRGHTAMDELRVVPWSGVQIAYRRPPYQNPQVTVYGESQQPRPIVFIFDCSMSMHNNRVTSTRRRIDVARDTLISILRRLSVPNMPYQIGMRIYAHRTGWIRDSDDIRIWDTESKNRKTVPATRDRHPNSDVELICRPRRFSSREQDPVTQYDIGWLIGRLSEAASHPMGETPLYLAIIQAMDDFPVEPGPKHIVAITDGLNDQYPDPNGPAESRKTALDVETALGRHPDVRLDIVGFDITDDIEELQDLSKQSNGGAFFSAADPKALLRALEESLRLSRYIVKRSGGDRRIVTPNRRPLDLNQPCIIEQPPGNRLGYIAQLVDSQFEPQAAMTLTGGEAIELFLSDDLRRLAYHRYTHNRSRALDNVPDPLDRSRRFYIEAEIPQWQGRGVRFAVSLQNADSRRFSPRPVEAWLQLQPVSADTTKAPPAYVFYNLDFQPNRPVPVLNYIASNWPETAESARLQIWFKLEKTPPQRRVALADLLKQRQISVDSLPGITFACNREKIDGRYHITVTERHPRGVTDIYTAKVEIQPPPAELMRRYCPESGIVLHTFVCDELTAVPIDQHEVLITSRNSLQADAVTLPRPMSVTVPDRGW